jgi:hypothetical protein
MHLFGFGKWRVASDLGRERAKQDLRDTHPDVFANIKLHISLDEAIDLREDLVRAIEEVKDHKLAMMAGTRNMRIKFLVHPNK